ncbi:MAG: SdpA family antimicrobial peptide system protein [Pseudonocardiaceae bacterium]
MGRPAAPDAQPMPDVQALGRRIIAMATAWAVAVVYVVDTQLPTNVLTLPYQHELATTVSIVAPQHWAFFTGSARQDRLEAWKPSRDVAGGWTSALIPRNLGGLDRSSRTRLFDIALLSKAARADGWVDCPDGDTSRCLNDAAPVKVVNTSRTPSLCGRIGLSRTEPLPWWMWRASSGTKNMPSRVVILDVVC